MTKAKAYYLKYLIIHTLFVCNLQLRDYLQSTGAEGTHTLSVIIMWVMLLFLLLRWDYILPMYKLNSKYTTESGRLVLFSSRINFLFYRLVVWGVTIFAPIALIIMGLNVNSLLVLYCALISYLFVYLNRRVLFDSFNIYHKDSSMKFNQQP